MAVEFKGVLLFQALWALNAFHVHRVFCLASSGVCRLEASEALGFLVPKICRSHLGMFGFKRKVSGVGAPSTGNIHCRHTKRSTGPEEQINKCTLDHKAVCALESCAERVISKIENDQLSCLT